MARGRPEESPSSCAGSFIGSSREPSKDLADLLELEAKDSRLEDKPAGLLTDEIEATFKEL